MTHLDLSTTRVRAATSDDAEALAGLAALTFPLACPPGASADAIAAHVATQLSPDRFRAWAASAAHALLVVEEPGPPARPLGYALLVVGVPDDADVADAVGRDEVVELSKIYVHPDAQGTGVAGALLGAALDAATVLAPGRTLWLGTNGLNARAQAFYRKHGFVLVGERTYVVGGERHSDVVMVHSA
ncbi:GNAT family N-acetyltransferase [Cellulosimicrobium sp. CUA-896]|uniref:GNAT family N-acetyltransferase n=1 Tax=Cellulosimicrobium sp. CUA-896 TaxID=1517881 RepID=UPI0021013A3C|nr:GNAT family N-acetyltransferase [Cellulosimicrobium sp. CUA-896]